MDINLTPEQEKIVNEELRNGHFSSVQEVIAEALAALRGKKSSSISAAGNGQQANAVREMLRFVESNRTTLHDISVKQLIHEGHQR
jgi:Arc/MetJ-type ribon-helix-helix transcriptional regulator